MSAARVHPIEAVAMSFARTRAHAAKVEGMLTSDDMIRKPHSDLEEMLVAQGQEWARLMLEENLRLRGQLERKTSVIGADGDERKWQARHPERMAHAGQARPPRRQ